jgi:ankyrin repeat protein
VSSIFDGHGAVASVILDRTALSVDQQGVTGNSLLMWAAYFGQTAVVKDLIKRGANAALVNVHGDTAITLARKQGHFDIATLLLAYSGNG